LPASYLKDVPLIRLPASVTTLEGFREWKGSQDRHKDVRISYIGDTIYIEMPPGGEMIEVPLSAFTFQGFRKWVRSERFPDWGRIAFLDQEIFIDMSPEELETHNKVKTAITSAIDRLNEELDLGELFSDGAWLTESVSGVSNEADATLVKWRTYQTGKVRLKPRKDRYIDFIEIQGSPDWVLEIVSRTSVAKDTQKLRKDYFRAGIREYWLIDARGDAIDFQLLVRRPKGFVAVKPRDGWYKSRVFGRFFRLTRRRNRAGRWQYKLEVKAA
jgi:Uma2 family endonuclease